MPIQFLFSKCADFNVVPEPQKQSKTILSGLEEVLIIGLTNLHFFLLGKLGIEGLYMPKYLELFYLPAHLQR